MCSSQLSHPSTQHSNVSAVTEAIRRLHHRIDQLESEIVDQAGECIDLRSEKRRLEGRLETLVSAFEGGSARLSRTARRVVVAEATMNDLRTRHDDLPEAFQKQFEAFQRHSAELQRIQVTNANMQAFLEQASRAEAYCNTGRPSYSHHTAQVRTALPQDTRPSNASAGYGHSRSTAPVGSPPTALPSASMSRRTTRQPTNRPSHIDVPPRQRMCPSLAEPPVIRGFAIPYLPDSPSPHPAQDSHPRGLPS